MKTNGICTEGVPISCDYHSNFDSGKLKKRQNDANGLVLKNESRLQYQRFTSAVFIRAMLPEFQPNNMKREAKRILIVLAMTSGMIIASEAHAQVVTTLSDFHNFHLSATYANWDADGSQIINGGEGYTPTLTSGATSFGVKALGYGSGAYNFSSPINAVGATEWQLTFTINNPTAGQGSFWMNPGVDIADGTHLVHLTATNTAGGFLSYSSYTAGTYTIAGNNFNDTFGGNPLDLSTITAFNLEMDPAAYDSSQGGPGTPYDITYQSFVLITPVPEPAALALLGLGVGCFAMARRCRKDC
jgi:hypothetical protein